MNEKIAYSHCINGGITSVTTGVWLPDAAVDVVDDVTVFKVEVIDVEMDEERELDVAESEREEEAVPAVVDSVDVERCPFATKQLAKTIRRVNECIKLDMLANKGERWK